MMNKPLLLPKKWLVAVNGIGLAMLIGAFNMRVNGQDGLLYLWIALGLLAISFFVVARDVLVNPIKYKLIWAISLAIFTVVASFVYLIVRDKMLEE